MANALKLITSRAKQLQKKHPNAKWTSLTKKASAEYRAGKLSRKPARKATPKKKARRKKVVTRTVTTRVIGKVSGHKKNISNAADLKRTIINDTQLKLIRATERLSQQKTKTAKKKLRKQITTYKATIKNVQAI